MKVILQQVCVLHVEAVVGRLSGYSLPTYFYPMFFLLPRPYYTPKEERNEMPIGG